MFLFQEYDKTENVFKHIINFNELENTLCKKYIKKSEN